MRSRSRLYVISNTGGRMHKPHIMSGGRYPVLRTVGILYLFSAAIVPLLGIVSAVWYLTQMNQVEIGRRVWISVTTFGGSLLAAITLLAMAEAIKLFMDMAISLRMMRPSEEETTLTSGEG